MLYVAFWYHSVIYMNALIEESAKNPLKKKRMNKSEIWTEEEQKKLTEFEGNINLRYERNFTGTET